MSDTWDCAPYQLFNDEVTFKPPNFANESRISLISKYKEIGFRVNKIMGRHYKAKNATAIITTANSDALACCEFTAPEIGTCVVGVGGLLELVPLPPPVVEFDAVDADTGPEFVTLKKFPATTLSANPAEVKMV